MRKFPESYWYYISVFVRKLFYKIYQIQVYKYCTIWGGAKRCLLQALYDTCMKGKGKVAPCCPHIQQTTLKGAHVLQLYTCLVLGQIKPQSGSLLCHNPLNMWTPGVRLSYLHILCIWRTCRLTALK